MVVPAGEVKTVIGFTPGVRRRPVTCRTRPTGQRAAVADVFKTSVPISVVPERDVVYVYNSPLYALVVIKDFCSKELHSE